ncbi:hypothetical protein EGW08_003301 [Elysia chlorotica]|uniref:Uncharacterized protein n=1 Tax=Elysia chlorotica TaxID=188477 RepID=A0A433U555_ELYCH|nr:hypothetical protein EGW08_003301 [Elysia chlorotica]
MNSTVSMMDTFEAAETNFGKFVPLHLLKFKGDHQLQSNFRHLIEQDYGKGIVKNEFGVCQSCGLPISSTSQIRMKSSRRKTRKVLKLLAKEQSGAVFGKHNNYVLQRYKKSCTQLRVRCSKCHNLNTQDLISNESKQAIKDKLLQEVLALEEVVPEKLTPSQKKKRRKKKKQKDADKTHCGLLLPNTPKTPSLDQDGKQKNPNSQSGSAPKLNHANWDNVTPIRTLSHKDTGVNSKSIQSQFRGKTQTPSTHPAKISAGKPSSGKKHVLSQKDLKQILQQDQAVTKRGSLTDFLSSL